MTTKKRKRGRTRGRVGKRRKKTNNAKYIEEKNKREASSGQTPSGGNEEPMTLAPPRSSKYIGVRFNRRNSTWSVLREIKGQKYMGENFADEISAAVFSDELVLTVPGAQNKLNFPESFPPVESSKTNIIMSDLELSSSDDEDQFVDLYCPKGHQLEIYDDPFRLPCKLCSKSVPDEMPLFMCCRCICYLCESCALPHKPVPSDKPSAKPIMSMKEGKPQKLQQEKNCKPKDKIPEPLGSESTSEPGKDPPPKNPAPKVTKVAAPAKLPAPKVTKVAAPAKLPAPKVTKVAAPTKSPAPEVAKVAAPAKSPAPRANKAKESKSSGKKKLVPLPPLGVIPAENPSKRITAKPKPVPEPPIEKRLGRMRKPRIEDFESDSDSLVLVKPLRPTRQRVGLRGTKKSPAAVEAQRTAPAKPAPPPRKVLGRQRRRGSLRSAWKAGPLRPRRASKAPEGAAKEAPPKKVKKSPTIEKRIKETIPPKRKKIEDGEPAKIEEKAESEKPPPKRQKTEAVKPPKRQKTEAVKPPKKKKDKGAPTKKKKDEAEKPLTKHIEIVDLTTEDTPKGEKDRPKEEAGPPPKKRKKETASRGSVSGDEAKQTAPPKKRRKPAKKLELADNWLFLKAHLVDDFEIEWVCGIAERASILDVEFMAKECDEGMPNFKMFRKHYARLLSVPLSFLTKLIHVLQENKKRRRKEVLESAIDWS